MGRDEKGVGIGEWASGYKVTGLQRLHGKFQSGEIIRIIEIDQTNLQLVYFYQAMQT